MITLRDFAREAKKIMAQEAPLAQKQEAIAAILVELSRRDDLMQFALPIGHSDASTSAYMLLRDGKMGLVVAGFTAHYTSPVHEHANFWVLGCGYRGTDRWKMYERLDDGSKPGYSSLRHIGEQLVAPQTWAVMPPPPRAIHQHNNLTGGETLELLFSYADPQTPDERLIYDVEGDSYWPSGFSMAGVYSGEKYPATWRTRLKQGASACAHAAKGSIASWRRPLWRCAACIGASILPAAVLPSLS